MYKVEVKNPCRCFLRSGMAEHQNFANLDEAKEEAYKMAEQMQKDFCKKHDFVVMQTGLTFSISIVPRG
ncbi:MAG: hypothetical protein PHW64_07155 [Sulfuricurvum sp.]|nr:hypothetical protein [Sulfuricurvum sp.]